MSAKDGLLNQKGMYIVSVKKAENVQWDNPNADFAISMQLQVEGIVPDTCPDPFEEWMSSKTLFDRMYIPTEDVDWYKYAAPKLAKLCEALGVDEDTLRSDASSIEGSVMVIKIKQKPGEWVVDKKTGLKTYQDPSEEVTQYYPKEFAEGASA